MILSVTIWIAHSMTDRIIKSGIPDSDGQDHKLSVTIWIAHSMTDNPDSDGQDHKVGYCTRLYDPVRHSRIIMSGIERDPVR